MTDEEIIEYEVICTVICIFFIVYSIITLAVEKGFYFYLLLYETKYLKWVYTVFHEEQLHAVLNQSMLAVLVKCLNIFN